MKNLSFIAAFALLFCLPLAESWAEIIGPKAPIEVPRLTASELLDVEEPLAAEEVHAVSVPEPTAFGLIALGLAVGGGLLVRRRTN